MTGSATPWLDVLYWSLFVTRQSWDLVVACLHHISHLVSLHELEEH